MKKNKLRKLVREEVENILSENMSDIAYKRHLEKLPITDDDVIEVEEGSHLGVNAPGGYKIKTSKIVLSRSSLKKAANHKGLKTISKGSEGFIFHVS